MNHSQETLFYHQVLYRMSPFKQFVQALSDVEVSQLVRGEAGIGCNDMGYCLQKGATPLLDGNIPLELAKEQLLGMEQQVLSQLYSHRPLCRVEFDYQAATLLATHGAARFCRHADQPDNWALMIDDHGLVAVGPEDVRSRYGYFCETDQNINDAQAASLVMTWLSSGAAYDDYQSKTVCRYCQ